MQENAKGKESRNESMSNRIQAEFWRGKNVLVTGHTGFKGAWLCQVLAKLGAQVSGISLAPEEPSLFSQARIHTLLENSNFLDITSFESCQQFITKLKPEIIFHLAAQALVKRAYYEPVETFASNVMGTLHLLQALRECDSARTVLITTTDKVYFNAESGDPFQEGDRLGSTEPYAASKAATEMVISCMRRTYLAERGIGVLSARAGNVLGGGDWAFDNLVPNGVRAVMEGKPLVVRNPGAVRPWQYVLDVLEGYLLLAERMGTRVDSTEPEDLAWNFGPDPASGMITVEQICGWMEEQWPQRFSWEIDRGEQLVKESKVLMLDASKAKHHLGWEASHSPESALMKTLKWYDAFLSGVDARDLCEAEIEEFLSSRTDS